MTCKYCGKLIPDDSVVCPHCLEVLTQTQKRENVITGTVGALIGAAIGGAVILLLGQLGFIASISGFILAICTLKGYELLGRKLTMKGAIICLILIAVTPYFANRLDWTLSLIKVFTDDGISVSLSEAWALFPELISNGIIPKGDYILGLVMLYVFSLAGAFGTLRDLFR